MYTVQGFALVQYVLGEAQALAARKLFCPKLINTLCFNAGDGQEAGLCSVFVAACTRRSIS